MAGNGGGLMYPPDFEEEPDETDEEIDNRATIRRYVEGAWNQGDLSVVDTLVSADYRRHHGNRVSRGRDSLKRLIENTRRIFPDLVIDVEDLIAAHDKVAARFTLTGTDRGGVAGDSATGIRVRIAGIAIFRLAGGLIAESWHSTDELGLLRQLGHVLGRPQTGP